MATQGEVIIGPLQKIVAEGNSYFSRFREQPDIRFRFQSCGRTLGWSEPITGSIPSKGFFSMCRHRRRVWIVIRYPSRGYGTYLVQLPVNWPSRLVSNNQIKWLSTDFGDDLNRLLAEARRRFAIWRASVFQRYRPKHGSFPNPGTNLIWNVNGTYPNGVEATVFPYNQYGSTVVSIASRNATSVNTPGFRTKKGLQLPVNPHSATLVRYEPGLAYYYESLANRGYWRRKWNILNSMLSGGWVPPGPVHNDQVLNKAISNVIRNSDAGLSANNAQNLAQFGQTVRLVDNSIWRIIGSLRALKRGNFVAAKNALWAGRANKFNPSTANLSKTKVLADNWLELQYGWKPLLNDIDGSIRALAKMMSNNTLITTVRGSSRKDISEPTIDLFSVDLAAIKVGRRDMVTRYGARVGIRYKVANSTVAFLAQTGFTNPVNLFWEILPFSFVLDWIIPIGPWLEHLSAFDGLTFVDGFQTRFAKQTSQAVCHYNGKHLPIYQAEPNHFEYGGRGFREVVILSRTKLTTWPRMSLPVFKNPLSVVHALNGLALLRQIVTSR